MFFRTMHGDVSTPSCCAFIHRFAFEEVSWHRVPIKSGLGNRGLSGDVRDLGSVDLWDRRDA